jgi:hypothetical protein
MDRAEDSDEEGGSMSEEQPTETPRTDAWTTYNGVSGIEYVYASVARRLELELAECKRELEALKANIQ